MAQLKDLIVNGASRFIGDIFGNKAQLTILEAPTSAGGTTYGPGSNGQVLKSNGSSLYWASDNNSDTKVTQTITSTTNADYRVLFSGTADDTTRTEGIRKDTDFKWNPSTNTLTAANVAGNAATATALTSNAGSSILPVYFTGGKPSATSPFQISELIQYTGSTSTWYVTTDITVNQTDNTWIYGTITGTRGTSASAGIDVYYQIYWNGGASAAENKKFSSVKYYDPLGAITSFSANRDADNKVYFTIVFTSNYSRVRILAHSNNDTANINRATAIATTAPATFAETVAGTKVNADYAVALTTSAGGARNPIYFSGGKPVAGAVTFDTLNTNRLMWTRAADQPYAGYHYADSTHIAVNSSTAPAAASNNDYNFYVNGTTGFNIGTNDSTSYKRIIVYGNNRYLSVGASGIQAYTGATSDSTASKLNLNYHGGTLGIGSSSSACDTTIYGTTTHSDYIYRAYTASDQTPMLWMNGSNYDNYLWQIGSGTANGKQYYGYGLKYIGTGSSEANYLRLMADNQNGTDVTAIGINQSGQVGIGADANRFYRLYVNGGSYHNGLDTHAGNIVPEANGTRGLGTTTGRWKHGYFTNYLYIGAASTSGSTTTANATEIGPGYIISNTHSAGNGIYIRNDSAQYGRWFVNTIGTASDGTTQGAQGEAYLIVGNSTARAAATETTGANNARGRIRLYGTGTNYTEIIPQANGDRVFYLPNYAGTMYAAHTSSNSAVGSTSQPVYVAANGRITAITGAIANNTTGSAAKLTTARSLKTKLDSTTAVTFDGSADQNAIPVTGTLPVGNGGTGATTAAGARTNLGLGNAKIYYGTCATAGGTAAKVVTCADYTNTGGPVKGDIVFVTFSNTNSAAVANLTLQVGSSTAKNIKYLSNAAVSNLPAVGYLIANYTYQFVYNGTYWVASIYYNTNTDTLLRTYKATNSIELPILLRNSAASQTATNTAISTYADSYGAIANTNSPTINPSTGILTINSKIVFKKDQSYGALLPSGTPATGTLFFTPASNSGTGFGSISETTDKIYMLGIKSENDENLFYNQNVYAQNNVLFGAAWNDYAEYRESFELEPGRVIIELGNGRLIRSTERLQPGAEVISDTYGFIIGEGNPRCSTPVAVAGRVLVYTDKDRYTFFAGDAVCSGPNGTVSKMTREEIKEYPERIIGTVSEIPEYDTWGANNIKVNNRIWIKLR